MMKRISSIYHVWEKLNQLVNLLVYTNWIYIESLFSQSNRLCEEKIKQNSVVSVCSVQCAGNSIKFYCMSLINTVFNFVDIIAEIYLLKEQNNASILIPRLNLLEKWSAKFNFEPLFGFINFFKEYLKHYAQNV
jgi:hypothetical protein